MAHGYRVALNEKYQPPKIVGMKSPNVTKISRKKALLLKVLRSPFILLTFFIAQWLNLIEKNYIQV